MSNSEPRPQTADSRWLLDTVPRVLFTTAIVLLGGWFLWRAVSPPSTAQAKIYEGWLRPLQGHSSTGADAYGEGTVERTSVNGRELFYVREVSEGTHDEILDDLQQRFQASPGFGLLATLPEEIDPAELWPRLTEEHLAGLSLQRTVVRIDGDGWGGLAYVDDGCPTGNQPGNKNCMRQKVEAFAATQDGTELGTIRSAVAIDGGHPHESTVFHVWSENGFHVGVPEDPADRRAPNLSPPGIVVPTHCTISSSYGQPGSAGGFYVATYECATHCEATLNDLDLALRAEGWKSDPVNETLRSRTTPTGQRFAISGVEAFATCSLSEAGGGTLLGIATYRM